MYLGKLLVLGGWDFFGGREVLINVVNIIIIICVSYSRDQHYNYGKSVEDILFSLASHLILQLPHMLGNVTHKNLGNDTEQS